MVAVSRNHAADSSSLHYKATILMELYDKSRNNEDSLFYQDLFFHEFPNTFSQLDSLYGYKENKPAILYYEAVDHIFYLFNNLKSIDEIAYYNKIIGIAFDGHWDADAINYFQNGLRTRVKSKPELIFELLRSKNDDQIIGFYYFFFHGVHPRWKKIPSFLSIYKTQYPDIYRLLEMGFKNALNDSGH